MYDPCEISSEIVQELAPIVVAQDFYWVRLQDLASQEIEDVPVFTEPNETQSSFVTNWTEGAARCDCVRALTFYKVRGLERHMKCGYKRMRLLGIWTPQGELIHAGD
jgi:hypothetical protein